MAPCLFYAANDVFRTVSTRLEHDFFYQLSVKFATMHKKLEIYIRLP